MHEWSQEILKRLAGLKLSPAREAEIVEEVAQHLEDHYKELIGDGATEEEARRVALEELDDEDLLARGLRQVEREADPEPIVTRRGVGKNLLESITQDLRYGVRMLSQNPGFTLAAVAAIALGIGINVGIFSVLNGAALRLLPVPRAEQMVSLSQSFHGHFRRNVRGEGSMFSYPEYLEYRDHNHVFSGLVAYEPFVEATLGGKLQQLLGTSTSCNYFDVVNVHPALGRGFLDSDCGAAGENAGVVISDALWRGTFGGDASILGKRIILNRTASIGVYGMVSYSVSRSKRDIGIRMALGADGRDVMKYVLRQAMRPVLAGGIFGVAACAAVSQTLSSMLFGLSTHDPVAFLLVPSFLLVVSLVASYFPARRATKVDPMVALRHE